ncbi:MAG TPA: hypothetical protein VJN90_03405 [Candidatus Acidoferrales bacterium]|nr:hypothetical protein [Candidatus Acidoferrales bacterium]
MCKFNDVYQRNVAFTALNSADVVSVQISKFGQLFLGQTALKAQLSKALAKDMARIGCSHRAIIEA